MNDIIFIVGPHGAQIEIIRLKENGEIYVKGTLVDNDLQLVDGLREFLKLSKDVPG